MLVDYERSAADNVKSRAFGTGIAEPGTMSDDFSTLRPALPDDCSGQMRDNLCAQCADCLTPVDHAWQTTWPATNHRERGPAMTNPYDSNGAGVGDFLVSMIRTQ